MTTSYTPILRLAQMVTGDPVVKNVWGTVWDGAVAAVESAIAGTTAISVAGLTALTLTAANNAPDQARQAVYNFTGALTANCTVTIPGVARSGLAINNTSGGFSIILTTGSGTTLTLPPTSGVSGAVPGWARYNCDGTNITLPATYLSNLTCSNALATLGADIGGLNLRCIGGTFGAGIRNDGNNVYLLGTAAGQPWGAFTAFRPFFWNLTTGVVGIDFTGAGLTLGATGSTTTVLGNLVGLGAISAPNGSFTNLTITNNLVVFNIGATEATIGGVTFGGGSNINSSGTATISDIVATIATIGSVIFPGGGVVNAGSITAASGTITNLTIGNNLVVFNIGATEATIGGVVFTGGSTLTASGLASIGDVVAGIGTVGGVVFPGSGALNTSGVIQVSGSLGVSSTGPYMIPSGVQSTPVAWSFGVGINVTAGVAAGGFLTVSDRRVKSQIEDLTPEQGYTWIKAGLPKTYVMNGIPHAGFIAQDDIVNGRGSAVSLVEDGREIFAESDGMAPAGTRFVRRYEQDIAYLTAALQGALERIADLEARA